MHINVGTPVHIFPHHKDGIEVVPEFEGRVGRVIFTPEWRCLTIEIYDKKIVAQARKRNWSLDHAFRDHVVSEFQKQHFKTYALAVALGVLLGTCITLAILK